METKEKLMSFSLDDDVRAQGTLREYNSFEYSRSRLISK